VARYLLGPHEVIASILEGRPKAAVDRDLSEGGPASTRPGAPSARSSDASSGAPRPSSRDRTLSTRSLTGSWCVLWRHAVAGHGRAADDAALEVLQACRRSESRLRGVISSINEACS
jgi:hypothetical protein